MAKADVTISSEVPDSSVMKTLAFVRASFLILVAAVSAVLLGAWLFPAVGRLLPDGWELMKADTALCMLCSAASLALFHPKCSLGIALISRCFSGMVVLVAAAVLVEYASGQTSGIDTLLASDSLSRYPGRMSLQTAFCLLLLGLILLFIRARKTLLCHIVDGLTLALVFLILVYIAGYCFGAIDLFGASMHNPISPQALLCLSLLTVVVFNDRAALSFFSVILGGGIAGKTARLALPFTITLPLLVAVLRNFAVSHSLMRPEYATALASSSSAMLFFVLVLLLSLRISTLERNIRELSLRDELTDLYNRRGFYFLATHALQLANRSGDPFSVLFLDTDNLKQINDTLGHEVGSELLREFAVVLKSTTRATDVVGRIGGDEFVVAGIASAAEIEQVVERIADATSRVNAELDRSYLVRYSAGHVTSARGLSGSLDDLLGQADKMMYEAKRAKRLHRGGQTVGV